MTHLKDASLRYAIGECSRAATGTSHPDPLTEHPGQEEALVDFELDEVQRAWLCEVREFLQENVTAALRAEIAEYDLEFPGGEVARFRRKIGEKGWFGLNWPAEYGGLGLSAVHQHLLMREFEYWGVPGPDLTVTSVAPMIMRHGTEQNKTEFLPPIARGEMICAVGYSEPDAGTDLASLRTRAVLEGDEWLINGSKIWNSAAQRATHEWLCVRTDPDAPRHRGISVIIVPIDHPGVQVRPLIAWSGYRTNEVFFDDVRVPVSNLIGEVNRGWTYITGALDLERGALTNAGDLRRALDELQELARQPMRDGSVPARNPAFRRRLARAEADVDVAILMGYEASSLLDSGVIPTVEVSVEKVFTSELRQRIADLAVDLLGPDGLLAHRSPRAPLDGKFERLYRIAPLMRFGAGANEVLRDIIAQRGHGMPSYGR
jgi:3-oxocholest-4-en-26-oyl-CoA dehydrogenase alpha subunit